MGRQGPGSMWQLLNCSSRQAANGPLTGLLLRGGGAIVALGGDLSHSAQQECCLGSVAGALWQPLSVPCHDVPCHAKLFHAVPLCCSLA